MYNPETERKEVVWWDNELWLEQARAVLPRGAAGVDAACFERGARLAAGPGGAATAPERSDDPLMTLCPLSPLCNCCRSSTGSVTQAPGWSLGTPTAAAWR